LHFSILITLRAKRTTGITEISSISFPISEGLLYPISTSWILIFELVVNESRLSIHRVTAELRKQANGLKFEITESELAGYPMGIAKR